MAQRRQRLSWARAEPEFSSGSVHGSWVVVCSWITVLHVLQDTRPVQGG